MTGEEKKLLRSFGLIMATVIVLLFGLLLPWIFEFAWPLWPWIVAAVFVVCGLLMPQLLAPVEKVWLKFGHVMGWINTRIILGVVYYLMIVPIALVMKVVGYDPMARKIDPDAESYRKVIDKKIEKKQMEKPF